jgi:hypothetical protein
MSVLAYQAPSRIKPIDHGPYANDRRGSRVPFGAFFIPWLLGGHTQTYAQSVL